MDDVISESPKPVAHPTLAPPQPCGVDVYALDRTCSWLLYIAAGWPWCMACFKLTEGVGFEYSEWAEHQRRPFLASPRFAYDLFDSYYHFLTLHQDGSLQAEWFWRFMVKIGGERRGTLPAMVDVERGGQLIQDPSRALVEDRVGAFARRYQQLSGRLATLYASEIPRSLGIQGLMGCGRSAIALYGAELHGDGESTEHFLQRTGTDLRHAFAWQYRGTDPQKHGPAGYPMTAPGCGAVDISAVILPGGLPALRSLAIPPGVA
jgi:hypothetical protein